MTRAEIIAELRRSAREDASPFAYVHFDAYYAARKFWIANELVLCTNPVDIEQDGTFFLLVAHALEDEC